MAGTFVTINAVAYDVITQGVTKKHERGGTPSRAFLGGLRTTFRWRKRTWGFKAGILTFAQDAALEANDGLIVACGGTMIFGDLRVTTIPCLVLVDDVEYVEDLRSGVNYSHIASVQLREQ